MKKGLLSLGLLIMVGGGCLSLPSVGQKTVVGDWHLSFDLPAGWRMVETYSDPTTNPITLSYGVDRADNQIIIQNVDKPLVLSTGAAPQTSTPSDTYVVGDGTRILVTYLDSRRVIPSEAEDLGDGFFRVMLCAEGGDCQADGRYNYDLYLVTATAKYKFEIQSQALNKPYKIAEDIVLSAKVTTVPEVTPEITEE